MNKLLTVLLASSLLTFPAAADGFEFEGGYSHVTAGEGSADLSFGSLYGVGGYRWDHSDSYSSSVEILLSIGFQDDDFFGEGVELTNTVATGYKGTWHTGLKDTQVFWRANYTQLTIDSSGADGTAKESDIGVGVGIIWKHVTIGYTTYLGELDDFDSFNIGVKF